MLENDVEVKTCTTSQLSFGGDVQDGVTCSDAVAWLRAMPDESVDLVLTDPAYESLEKHRKKGTTTRLKHSKSSSNDWFSIFPNERFEDLFRELYRVLKTDRHFYMLCDQETMFYAKPVSLLRMLIEQSTQPGELVIDPFCGSGSTGVAAVLDGRRFAGCDLSESAALAANERVVAVDPETDLRTWDIEYGDWCVMRRDGIQFSFSRYDGGMKMHVEDGGWVRLQSLEVADDKTMMRMAVNAAVKWKREHHEEW